MIIVCMWSKAAQIKIINKTIIAHRNKGKWHKMLIKKNYLDIADDMVLKGNNQKEAEQEL